MPGVSPGIFYCADGWQSPPTRCAGRSRHSGRAQREPEPLAATSSSPARSSSWTVHAAGLASHVSRLSTRTYFRAALLNGFRVGTRLRLACPEW